MEGNDTAEIRRVSEELMNASHKLAETMYQQASGKAGAAGSGVHAGGGGSSADDDVVDADFEEVKDK
jgi:molecular chaperone DnaK